MHGKKCDLLQRVINACGTLLPYIYVRVTSEDRRVPENPYIRQPVSGPPRRETVCANHSFVCWRERTQRHVRANAILGYGPS